LDNVGIFLAKYWKYIEGRGYPSNLLKKIRVIVMDQKTRKKGRKKSVKIEVWF